jgi:Flp pilus assembly protein TadD
MRYLLSGLCLLSLSAASACGSSVMDWDPLGYEPPRPPLVAADTNSAHAYFAHGERLFRDNPQAAADAFYWASRLDPTWADPLYARRMALFMASPDVFSAYVRGLRTARESPGVRQADSLYHRALTMNPFLRNRFDAWAVRQVLAQLAEQELRRNNPTALVDPGIVDMWIEEYLRRGDARVVAWVAHSEGRFGDALDSYYRALRRSPGHAGLHADMGRALFLSGRYEEARSALARAAEFMREEEEEELVRVYESKALFEHSIGLIHEHLNDPAGARDAYARALQEDLSYYPAHVRLGELALADGDTLTAVSQLALAAEIRDADPGVSYQYGRLLARVGQLGEARAELERAIELEPYFAPPYYELASVLHMEGRAPEAAVQYRAFLERSSRDSPWRGEAERRLAQIEAGAAPDEGGR